MDLKKLVKQALEREGFDGLFNLNGACACTNEDLFPCEQPGVDCEPGYLAPCDGTCNHGDCPYHIQKHNKDSTKIELLKQLAKSEKLCLQNKEK